MWVIWKADLVSQHVGKGCMPIGTFERRGCEQHLICQNANTPPIDSGRMTAAFDHFRRDVPAVLDIVSQASH